MSEAKKEVVEEQATEAKSDKVTVCANKEKYVKTRTPSGKASMNCGDAVATAFSGLSIGQKYTLTAKLISVDEKELAEKYGHLNVGMQGMSLANRARGAINKDAKLENPVGLLEQMNKLVAPVQKANADAVAKEAKAKEAAKATKAKDEKAA